MIVSKNPVGSPGSGSAPPAFSVFGRVVLCLPLVAVSVAFAVIAVIGVAHLPEAERLALPVAYARAATTALICLVLAIPAAACRPSVLWVLPLAATTAAGYAGWALLPQTGRMWGQSLEAAVLLLPVMVLVLGAWWRRIPLEMADTLAAMGASPARVWLHAVVQPALPGAMWALAVVFVLALGLAPLLAPGAASP